MRRVSDAPADPQPPDIPPDLDPIDHVPLGGIDRASATGLALAGSDLRRLEILESVLERVDLGEAQLGDARIADVHVEDGSWANVRAPGVAMRRAAFAKVRMTGLDLSASQLEDCVFRDCRIDLASFRFARLERVRFERCVMDEADLANATLESVVFEECQLGRSIWAHATCSRSELRGCEVAGALNAEAWRGMRLPWPDAVAAAGELAAALGIQIVD
jgi:uncharacterized protein YjbI with pentapeptide repeats